MEFHCHEFREILQVLAAPSGMVSIYIDTISKELIIEPVHYVARIRNDEWVCHGRGASPTQCHFRSKKQLVQDIGQPSSHVWVAPLMFIEGWFELEENDENHLGYEFTHSGELTEEQRTKWMDIGLEREKYKQSRLNKTTP